MLSVYNVMTNHNFLNYHEKELDHNFLTKLSRYIKILLKISKLEQKRLKQLFEIRKQIAKTNNTKTSKTEQKLHYKLRQIK